MGRTILHVDMDAFYAAIEQRDRIQLRGKPVIVGADPKNGRGRGIVSTCSYEARRFGVHSAQPISKAWRLCPQGIYVRPDMAKYARVSERIMSLLMEFSDLVEQEIVQDSLRLPGHQLVGGIMAQKGRPGQVPRNRARAFRATGIGRRIHCRIYI